MTSRRGRGRAGGGGTGGGRRSRGENHEAGDPQGTNTDPANVQPQDDENVQRMDLELDDEQEMEPGGRMVEGIYIPPPPPAPEYSGDKTGTRLVITYIENYNFKSYAGTERLGPFHKNFTAIIGPNGSGKSNVIDSMLFVFGYRATKLRLKKLSALIHHSDRFPNCSCCRVTIHFALLDDREGDDSETMRFVPGSEFTVSRTAEKNNSSYYQIDERRVQFSDVRKLLQGHGIDLKYNRFLILQGEVEQIALMKPKAEQEGDVGMLEFLEDIIGSNRLKAPLSKLQQRVEEANVERAQMQATLKMARQEMDALEGPKNETLRFLEAENERAHLKNKLFQIKRATACDKVDEAVAAWDESKAELEKALEAVKGLEEQRKVKETERKEKMDLFEKKKVENELSKKKFDEMERLDATLRASITEAKKRGKEIVAELQTVTAELEELRKFPEKADKDKRKLEEKAVKLESEKVTAEERLKEAQAKIGEETTRLSAEKAKYDEQILQFQNQKDSARQAYEMASNDLSLLRKKESDAKNKLESIIDTFKVTSRDLASKRDDVGKYQRDIPKFEEDLSRISTDMQTANARRDELHAKLREAEQHLADARDSLQSSKSRNETLNKLLAAQSRREVSGIIGRLGDLGGIDKKYDVAVSTASGSLDHLVVETKAEAVKVIAWMKANNVPPTNFLALDTVTENLHGGHERQVHIPENCARLFDLITVNDEKIRPLFYYALRDTLVVRNMDEASRVAFGGSQRWRVVTLDGKIVETSGAMTGGGRPASGRMGTSAARPEMSREDFKQLENTANTIRVEFTQAKEACADVELEWTQKSKELEAMKKKLPTLEMEVVELEKLITSLEKRVEQAKKEVEKCRPDEGEVARKNAAVDEARVEMDRVESLTHDIEEKADELDSKIRAVIDKNVGAERKRVNDLTKQLKTIRSEITKCEVERKNAERNASKAENTIATLEADKLTQLDTIQKLKVEMAEMVESAKEITENFERLESECKEAETEVAKIQGEIDKLKREESALIEANMDKKARADEMEAAVKQAKREVTHWDKQLRTIELHELESLNVSIAEPEPSARLPKPSAPEIADSERPSTTPSEQPSDDVLMDTSEPGAATEPIMPPPPPPPSKDSLPQFTREQLENFSLRSINNHIEKLDSELSKAKPNMSAITEYKRARATFQERSGKVDEATRRRDTLKEAAENVSSQRLREFKDGFLTISRQLKDMYRMITLGGDAELEFVDSCDPFTEGVAFTVRPNKKTWKKISNLSGGEKTLSSLSLIFALHYYKPSPLYVMDEIDAALDFRNVSIVANYIKQRTQNTQFIIISLRNNMFELADRLTGIYKTYNCTHSVTVNPKIAESSASMQLASKRGLVSQMSGTNSSSQQQQPQAAARSGLSQRPHQMTTTVMPASRKNTRTLSSASLQSSIISTAAGLPARESGATASRASSFRPISQLTGGDATLEQDENDDARARGVSLPSESDNTLTSET